MLLTKLRHVMSHNFVFVSITEIEDENKISKNLGILSIEPQFILESSAFKKKCIFLSMYSHINYGNIAWTCTTRTKTFKKLQVSKEKHYILQMITH